jgi:hypothetical protein
MTFSPEQLQVINACFAYSERRRQALNPNTRIAYYTTAETALKIIQNRTFWLRNPQLMNDYAEVIHGEQCLQSVMADPEVIAKAADTVDVIFPGFFANLANTWTESNRSGNTLRFVACLSEIDVNDDMGALSMWRAYGGNNGVALVMSNSLLDLDANFINTFHSPVLYGDASRVKELFVEVLQNIFSIQAVVSGVGVPFLKYRLLNALEFAMLSVKHVGFSEEKEWRMIHHLSEESMHLKYRSEVVRGNAEVICEINLNSHPALAPAAMIDKVIVGPCAFPASTAMAIRQAFHSVGGTIPSVVTSDIPLRHF